MTDEYLPAEPEQEEELKAPFSFKLMIFLTVIYLGWRLIEAIMWLVEQLT